MNQLAAICVKRPVFATVLILVLVVFGMFGYTKLGLDRFPKVDFPIITVTTRQPGSAPEDIETQITDKIEEAVNTISGIEELRSTSVGRHFAGLHPVRAGKETSTWPRRTCATRSTACCPSCPRTSSSRPWRRWTRTRRPF